MSNILVISPHPDDESIGCGGAILTHVAAGDTVHVVFLTTGEKGGHGLSEAETRIVREREAREAAKILQIHEVEFWGAPDGQLRATPTFTAMLLRKVQDYRADVIYVPHENEMHPDHRAAARMVSKVLRHSGEKPPRVLMYEVWTPIQEIDEVLNITQVIQKKSAAISVYESQCAQVDFVEAARGLNRYRGEMHCWPEGEYAEVFKRMKP